VEESVSYQAQARTQRLERSSISMVFGSVLLAKMENIIVMLYSSTEM
jgi:hypothetical protein